MSSFEQLSGLPGEVRSSLTSEQFDLANYTEQRCADFVRAAFSAPLTAPTQMVRFTFVVGGGKLVRQKYNDDLPKWMATALRDVGYVEDRSAAETFDSQGTFKQQHDTGQNLKYVIVFPRVTCATAGTGTGAAAGMGKGGDAMADGGSGALDTKSPEYIVCACELSTFKEIVASKTTSWRQRKKLLKVVQDGAEAFQAIEGKLVAGQQLTPKEQAIYESNSGADAEKISWLQGEVKKMVDEGKLTASEKEELLSSLEANVKVIDEEKAAAAKEGKEKKVEALEAKKQGVVTRKGVVQKIEPVQHRLKHSDEVQKLRLRLLPLLVLEDKGRSCSLTLADLKTLEEKSDLEEKIQGLEAASRGWWEDDADFDAKCRVSHPLPAILSRHQLVCFIAACSSLLSRPKKRRPRPSTMPRLRRRRGRRARGFRASQGQARWAAARRGWVAAGAPSRRPPPRREGQRRRLLETAVSRPRLGPTATVTSWSNARTRCCFTIGILHRDLRRRGKCGPVVHGV